MTIIQLLAIALVLSVAIYAVWRFTRSDPRDIDADYPGRSHAQRIGREAYASGRSRLENPYEASALRESWEDGWHIEASKSRYDDAP